MVAQTKCFVGGSTNWCQYFVSATHLGFLSMQEEVDFRLIANLCRKMYGS